MTSSDKGGEYWQREAESFAAYYERQPPLKRVVTRFLDSRTTTLMSLLDCQKETVLLDLGCGSGVHLQPLVGRCGEVVGVDRSAQMLAMAESRLRSVSSSGWRLQLHDAEQALPFADRSFDWVISLGLLDYVSSPSSILAECSRVLKDRGQIVFTIPKRPSIFALLRTPPGNLVKRLVFDLPPIRQAVSRTELDTLLRSSRMDMKYLTSIWTAMWVVKASKTEF